MGSADGGWCEGGNPSVRCGNQLPLHRGAKGDGARLLPPLCKGRWQTDEGRLTEGLSFLQYMAREIGKSFKG